MTTRAELQKQLELAISPWKSDSSTRPPFTDVDLITIALFLNEGPMEDKHIVDWIRKTFPFWTMRGYESPLWIGFQKVQLPAIRVWKEYSEPRGSRRGDWSTWELVIPDASLYVRTMIEPKPQTKASPFLELPAELRNRIYEMVFSYPRSGLSPGQRTIMDENGSLVYQYRPTSFGSEFKTISKDISTPFSFDAWKQKPFPYPYREKSQRILSLLSVNKQIFEESYAIFYHINTFYFEEVIDLEVFLRRLPSYRRQHLRHVAFKFTHADLHVAANAFRYLASIPRLQKLDIHNDEPRWKGSYIYPDKFDVREIPGLHILHRVQALEVAFDGNCPNVSAYLKPAMEGTVGQTSRGKAQMTLRASIPRAAKVVWREYFAFWRCHCC